MPPLLTDFRATMRALLRIEPEHAREVQVRLYALSVWLAAEGRQEEADVCAEARRMLGCLAYQPGDNDAAD